MPKRRAALADESVARKWRRDCVIRIGKPPSLRLSPSSARLGHIEARPPRFLGQISRL
jgi:hypothetical protein